MSTPLLRDEARTDAPAIRALIVDAFRNAPHSSGTEAAIVDAVREAGALTLSLVAEEKGNIVGHIAFSPVSIDGRDLGWFGLGPVAVTPDRQRSGIGSALIRRGLDLLLVRGAPGCVLLGDPAYYARFGFANDSRLTYRRIPPPYFQRLVWSGAPPVGEVAYHPAFYAS